MTTTGFGFSALSRCVKPELLDTLSPDDPRAIASRRDLRRINRLMATRTLMFGALGKIVRGSQPIHLVELGAGDGELMLPLARRRSSAWPRVGLELLDLQPVVSQRTVDAYRTQGWDATVTRADVFDWLARPASGTTPVVIIANLFLHHFEGPRLCDLLRGIAARSIAFVCCEPRRSRFALAFSRSLGVIGCNAVTRHDAVASVHAGFRARELTGLWPNSNAWSVQESAAGLFTHRFQALKKQL